ncbi:MAG TPA: heme utilization cystosolic carrier protein HutX [Hyphomicrobium sp.]|nr:heme utilization cystosolic carrier protein HutX [Hyphomicrobium sp.]
MQTVAEAAGRPPLVERLAKNQDGILEQIARDYGVSTFDVVREMPADYRVIAPGEAFDGIMSALTTWGDVLFIVHTADIVLECEGAIPPGTVGRGYFNLHGDSPIGGHIKSSNCTHVAFVSRPFMGRESRSIQFFNASGEAMFKIFVRRDAQREMIAEQVVLFDELRATYA